MNRASLLIAAILAVCLWSQCATAAPGGDAIATVVAVRGQVTATAADGASRTLAIKAPLYVEDRINTGKLGRVQLLFSDATIISLAPATEMALAEYKWDPAARTGAMKTQVKEGTFRVMGGALTKFAPQKFTTETPTATIGIRGSMYAGSVRGNSLSVVFNGGKGIDIVNAAGRVAITKPGFGTHVQDANQPPAPPRKFTAAEMGTLNESLTSAPKPKEEEKTAAANEPAQTKEEQGAAPASPEETGEQPAAAADSVSSSAATDDQGAAQADTTGTAGAAAETTTGSGTLSDSGDSLAAEPIPVAVATATVTATTQTSATSTATAIYDPTANPANQPEATQAPTVDTRPTDGISAYLGKFSGQDSSATDQIFGDVLMMINWHNGKAFGLLQDQSVPLGKDYGPPAFFIGAISGATMTDVHVFGTSPGDPNIPGDRLSSLVGTGTGTFLGSDFGIFDATASGEERNLTSPGIPLTAKWDVTVTAARQPQDKPALRGTANWAGYVVGISENVNAPDIERKLFMNNLADATAEHFTLAIDKDKGTVAGSLRAIEIDGSNNGSIDLTIGGAFGSAFIHDKGLAALIGCAGNCINDGSTLTSSPNVTLTPYGNYLLPEAPDRQFSDYASWGFWEVSHQEADGPDPDLAADIYHTHAPYSMWIAGQKTPATFVANLIDHTTFVGRYAGMAQGTMIDAMNHASPLTNGRSSLAIDFGRANMASAITGTLAFDQVSLAIDSPASALTPYGFKGYVPYAANPGIINGAVNGAFYGPGANTVGGNFQAEFSTARYLGIFGANLTNGPAQ